MYRSNSVSYLHFFTLCVGVLLSPALYAQSLSDFEKRFDAELEKIQRSAGESEESLRKNYLGALLRFEAEARRSGDLEGLEIARREIQRVESQGPLETDVGVGHERIDQMRGIIREKMKEIRLSRAKRVAGMVEGVERYARNQAKQLTRDNQITDAKAWRDWSETLRERPKVAKAMDRMDQVEARKRKIEKEANDPSNFHPSLRGTPVELVNTPGKEFPDRPTAYVAGKEPQGEDKRLGGVRTPSAAGSGMTLVTSRVKLVEDESTLSSTRSSYHSSKRKQHVYVPRLEISPLPNKSLGRSLVVFDLYRRGSGSKREVIRTDRLLLPPLESGRKVVLDSGPYEYETYKIRSSYFGNSKSSTAHEFYGFIVSIFDQDGKLFYQRATESGLEDYARERVPSFDAAETEEGAEAGEDEQNRLWRRVN